MSSFIRNILLSSLLLLIVISVLKCGSGTESTAVTKASTYKNLSADVKYVGINKCKQCHFDKYETFIETGMGKSFDRATMQKSSARFEKSSLVYDKFSDLYYHPFWSGDTMKIMEFRLEGKDTVHKRIETVDYIIGSGHHTNSHILEENGYFYQMPVTFYTQKGAWDLPPGFEKGYNSRFSRKIGLECMSCHNSLPDFVEGSENKFNSVPNGIGCERCHGPGEVHVQEKEAGLVVDTSKEIDYSIVNPAKLSVDLQFDVCQRCHLQGNTVLKEGKSFYDFHPGMKLSDVMDVFLPKYENGEEDFIMASHADRLRQSKCFVKSQETSQNSKENNLKPFKNGLTCVTCHNPHVSVKVTGKEVFNSACKNCHGNKTQIVCSEKEEARNKVQDNCISCHMRNSGSIDIPHVSITDHFIRKPSEKVDVESLKKFIGLFAINEKNPSLKIKAEAYLNQFEKFDSNPALLDSAEKLLRGKDGHDFHLYVRLCFLKGYYQELLAMANGKSSELQAPGSKSAWSNYYIGEALSYSGRKEDAASYYQRAAERMPYNLDFQNKLAGSFFSQQNLKKAQTIYEKILVENPKYTSVWSNLGFIYLQLGDKEKAMSYYEKALALDPDYESALINKAGLLAFENKKNEAMIIAKKLLQKNSKNEMALEIKRRCAK